MSAFSVLNTHINTHCIIIIIEAYKEDSGDWKDELCVYVLLILIYVIYLTIIWIQSGT